MASLLCQRSLAVAKSESINAVFYHRLIRKDPYSTVISGCVV